MMDYTIVAQATPVGKNGISVVRMSGEKSLEIATQIFVCSKIKEQVIPNYMYVGKVDLGGVFDKCCLVYFKNPHSYTGEDVVEFQCHGGFAVGNKIIESCVKRGAKIAQPGEFSKRAFLNGKMTLDEAEGVIDTINAETESQLRAGNELTKGSLFKMVDEFQTTLTNILAEIEVNLDYPEHDIEYKTKEQILNGINNIEKKIKNLVETEKTGKIIKNGIDVCIVGKTNVGKSSLLNALIGKEQAIVTNIEGTTRDVVCASMEYKGIKINFYDTAGIRKTTNQIEKIGIEKTKEILNNCDVVVFVFDSSLEISKEEKEFYEKNKNKNKIVVFNKSDKENKIDFNDEYISISAKQNKNIDLLKEKIFNAVSLSTNTNSFVLTNARHVEVLKEALAMIENTKENIFEKTLDILSLEIKDIWNKIGEITGRTENEEIIDKIFSKFCLGK